MKKIIILSVVFLLVISLILVNERTFAKRGYWSQLSGNYLFSEIRDIEFNPYHLDVFYLATWGEGVYKTTDGGENFKAINNGITDPYIHCISIDAKNPNIIYAGTANGVFVSSDSGESWHDAGYLGLDVTCLQIDPSNSQIIYAGVSNEGAIQGVFKSVDGGNSWESVGLQDDTVFSILVKPDNSSLLYAGCWEGVYISTNGGITWESSNFRGQKVNYLLFHPINYDTVYVASDDGVFKSNDSFQTFEKIGSFEGSSLTLAIDYENPEIIYAGTSNGEVFKSIDSGNQWQKLDIVGKVIFSIKVNTEGTVFIGKDREFSRSKNKGESFETLVLNPDQITKVIVDPKNENVVYASSMGGVIKSDDMGKHWNKIGLYGISCLSIAINPLDTNTLYVGTEGHGIFESHDGGENWENITKGWPTEADQNVITSIAVSPSTPNVIYAGAWSNLYKSYDGGKNWQCIWIVQGQETPVYEIEVDPVNNDVLFIATHYGVYRSLNGGLSFEYVLRNEMVKCIAISEKDTNYIYAGTIFGGIFKSEDRGKTWSKAPITNPQDYIFFSLAVHPSNPNKVYAVGALVLVGRFGGLWFEVTKGIFIDSFDGGLHWNTRTIPFTITYVLSIELNMKTDCAYLATTKGAYAMNLSDYKGFFSSFGFPDNYVRALLFENGVLYAGSDDGNIGKSSDYGKTWLFSALFSPSINCFAASPENPFIVLGGTNLGILKSNDGGNSWNEKRSLDKNTHCIVFNNEKPGTVFAGTEEGIYVSSDNGNTWKKLGLDDLNVLSLLVNPYQSSVIIAGTDYGVLKSNDSGNSWALSENVPGSVYALVFKEPDIVFAGTDEGLFLSSDVGETWHFAGLEGARIFCFMSGSKEEIYAGTDSGVFLSEDSGDTWDDINNGLTNFNVNSIINDDKGNLYIGTDGGGIFKWINSFEILVKTGDNGNISPSGPVYVNAEESQTFAITPDHGYKIKDVLVDGVSVGKVNTYTFESIMSDHLIEAVFEPLIYTIVASSNSGGSVTPSGTITLNYGDSKSFTITPNEGYKISYVKVDGISQGELGVYTFVNVTSNHVIEVIFERKVAQTTIVLQIDKKNFTVNGSTRTLDSPPIIKNSRTLLPIRAVVEALGGTVSWDAAERKVTVSLGSTTIELWIGKSIAKINGIDSPIDPANSKVVPEIINGRTMLPLRFVTENLGCDVIWDGTTKTITIIYKH